MIHGFWMSGWWLRTYQSPTFPLQSSWYSIREGLECMSGWWLTMTFLQQVWFGSFKSRTLKYTCICLGKLWLLEKYVPFEYQMMTIGGVHPLIITHHVFFKFWVDIMYEKDWKRPYKKVMCSISRDTLTHTHT